MTGTSMDELGFLQDWNSLARSNVDLSYDLYQMQVRYLWWASLVTQMVKNLPTKWETWIQSLDWEDPLEKAHVRGARQAAAHGVAKSQTPLKQFSIHA